MKLLLLLTSSIVSILALVLFAFGPVPAVGMVTIGGTLAVLACDYDTTRLRKLSRHRAKQPLPLAA